MVSYDRWKSGAGELFLNVAMYIIYIQNTVFTEEFVFSVIIQRLKARDWLVNSNCVIFRLSFNINLPSY